MKDEEIQNSNGTKKSINYFMNSKNWHGPLIFIFIISVLGVGMIGYQTYVDAPPLCTYTDNAGTEIISKKSILKGQEVFHKYALMEFGSLFGDGAQRGPDFTAEALHEISLSMNSWHREARQKTDQKELTAYDEKIIAEQVREELKINRYQEEIDQIQLTGAQIFAVLELRQYYIDMFVTNSNLESFPPKGYISDTDEIHSLSDFFFWSAWVCVTVRPGNDFSYTHNWPYDPFAGNEPTSPVVLWSVLGMLAFVLGIGIVLYFIGQYNQMPNKMFHQGSSPLLTNKIINNFSPTPTQRASYKFFAVAIILFLLQVICGFLTINEFVDFLAWFNIEISSILPITVTRSWHLMLALYWISTCWIASSIFILPILSKQEIKGQLGLVNILFTLLFILVGGSLAGMFLGPLGILGEWWRQLGHQGWEYVDFGKIYQGLLMIIFILWAVVVYRGVKPVLFKGEPWNLPNWILYSVIGIPILFISGFVSQPETSFVIADFWRWMVIHMWVEAFFEVFITVIVSYLLVLMGLVSKQAATRVVYIATLLFLGTGLLGISHNFYWNAKPVATMAIGSVFSTMQFIPLILLTVEAWRFKNMPQLAITGGRKTDSNFAFPEVFLFLVAVNFWNFLGAGVMGIIINLPIMNYFEHGTYLTVNHAHAALMGVYGNISLGALFFAAKLLLDSSKWNKKIVHFSFWSINVGLFLMVILDLFPAGAIQFKTVVDEGLWFARSEEFIKGSSFESLTWLRSIGASLFFFGGVCPASWFLVKNWTNIRKTNPQIFLFGLKEENDQILTKKEMEIKPI